MPRPDPNLNVPPIPAPNADFDSLVLVADALTEAVESLSGQRGSPSARAVTFDDLIALGLVDNLTVQGLRADGRGGLRAKRASPAVSYATRTQIEELRARIEKLEKASEVTD